MMADVADAVGVVSSTVRDMALRICPEAEEKMVVVPGAVREIWRELPPVERDPASRLLTPDGNDSFLLNTIEVR